MTRWPAMMKRQTAAEYCDLSVAAFEREVIAGRLPSAIVFGGRDHWRREAIDAALALLDGAAPEADYRRRLKERYGQAA